MNNKLKNKSLSKAKKNDQKSRQKPFYGIKTKKQVIEEYYNTSASMKELSEIHGILGSNTLSNWLKKYGNLGLRKNQKPLIMTKPHSTQQEKDNRKKRYKTNEQIYIGQLESELILIKKRMRFYLLAVDLINELALELIGIYL